MQSNISLFGSSDKESLDLIPKKKSISSQPKYIHNKRVLKDFDTFQQAFLLGLLNVHCGFTIKKQRKETTVTCTSPVLQMLHFPNEEFEILGLADNYCRPFYCQDVAKGMPKTTAFRRIDKNRKNFVQNLLIDLSMEFGYFFESSMSRKSKKTMRVERIKMVYLNDKLLFNQNDIADKGKRINEYITKGLKKNALAEIKQNDPEIMKLLWGSHSDFPIC